VNLPRAPLSRVFEFSCCSCSRFRFVLLASRSNNSLCPIYRCPAAEQPAFEKPIGLGPSNGTPTQGQQNGAGQ